LGKSTTLAIKIVGDATSGVKAMGDAEHKSGLLGSSWAKAGLAAGVVLGGVVALGKASFDAASDLQQNAGAVEAIFGASAEGIKKNAAAAADAVGLSTSAYDGLAAVLGAQLKSAGFEGDKLSGKVTNLIGLGSDLAAQFGGSTSDAVDALSSVLKGETDPIERYGVSIKQADISARLAAQGQSKLTGTALKNAQANAALGLVMEQTAAAHGQFNKQGNTAAEVSQKASAMWDNMKAKLGTGLLPIFVTLMTFMKDTVGPAFTKLTADGSPLMKMFDDVGKFVTVQLVPALRNLWQFAVKNIIPAWVSISGSIMKVAVPAFKAIWAFIQNYAVPIFKSVLGPVIKGVVSFWHSLSDAIAGNKDKFQAIWDKVKPFADFIRDKVAPVIGTVLGGAFTLLGKLMGPVVDLITWVLDKVGSVLGFIGKVGGLLFGASSPGKGGGTVGAALAGAGLVGASRTAGALRTASSVLVGGGPGPDAAGQGLGGTTVNITVQGMILDPTALAAQLQGLLDRYATRTGARVALALS
jgi:hypothetical protein